MRTPHQPSAGREASEGAYGLLNYYLNCTNDMGVWIQKTKKNQEYPSPTFHGALMFSLLSQLLTVETAFSAILASLIAHDALPVHGRSLLCPVYEGCLVASPLITVRGAELPTAL